MNENLFFSSLNMFKSSQSKPNEEKLIDPANYHPKSPLDNLVIKEVNGVRVAVGVRQKPKKEVKKEVKK